MKTLTITLHDTDNCGSSLQAFALQHFLFENNIENQIINYLPSYVKNNGHPFKSIIRKILLFRDSVERTKKFKNFISKYLVLTSEKYTNYDSLKSNPPLADVYLSGSDQLWNVSYACGRDEAFYLNFVCSKKKLAYAVSLGKSNLLNNEIEWIISNVRDFDWISVREKSSQKLLEVNGVAAVDYVCDPVLLLNKDIYKDMQSPVIIYKDYIFIYLVEKSELLENIIQYLKDNFEYKVVLGGSYGKKCTCDIHLKDIGPCEFLYLINNAKFVISGSFHATVFSSIFHKSFAVVLPSHNQARIEQFLEILELQRCIIRNIKDIQKAMQQIDYDLVDRKLAPFVNNSKNALLQQIIVNQK